MERLDRKFKRSWQAVALGGKPTDDILNISSLNFKHVIRSLREKGYVRRDSDGSEIRYDHYSIRGLSLFINKEHKCMRAEALSETVLSEVATDFDLPLYRH